MHRGLLVRLEVRWVFEVKVAGFPAPIQPVLASLLCNVARCTLVCNKRSVVTEGEVTDIAVVCLVRNGSLLAGLGLWFLKLVVAFLTDLILPEDSASIFFP